MSPRPCSVRRFVVKKRTRIGGVNGFINSVKNLQRREISSKCDLDFTMSDVQERFHNIHLQVSIIFIVLLFSLLCPSFVVNFEPLMFMGYEFSSSRFGKNEFLFLGY